MIVISADEHRLRQMLGDARAILAWLEYCHPHCQPTLCLTWSRQAERIRHVTVVDDQAWSDQELTAEAVLALAALGWPQTRVREVVPFIVYTTELSNHQRLAAVARIEEALRRL